MEETRVSTEQSYLNDALSRGDGYYKRVKIGGKYYTAMMIRGGDVTRFPAQTPESTREAHKYSEMFFDAHKTAYTEKTGNDLSDQSITHIDIEGIKDEDGLIQEHSKVGLSDTQKDHLMAEFDREKNAIVQQYTLDRPTPVAKDAVPLQFRAHLPERENELYDKAAIKEAINSYARSRFNRIKDVVVSSNPECEEGLDTQLRQIAKDNPNEVDYKKLLDESSAALKQHMTAQTAWKAMMNVLLPDQLIYVTDTEEEEMLLVGESELGEEDSLSHQRGHFDHLDSLNPLQSRREEARLDTHEDRGSLEDSFEEELTPKPTKETWGAMFSRWGTNAYGYVPSMPFSKSTTTSRVDEEFELESVVSPSRRVVSFEELSSEEEEFLSFSDEEEGFLDSPVLHSVHKPEEIPVLPVTAKAVFSELTLVAQRAPKDDISVHRKQAAAITALAKIDGKIKKAKDISPFTEDEQRVINEAITRNIAMKGRDQNSQLTAIIRTLRTISAGR